MEVTCPQICNEPINFHSWSHGKTPTVCNVRGKHTITSVSAPRSPLSMFALATGTCGRCPRPARRPPSAAHPRKHRAPRVAGAPNLCSAESEGWDGGPAWCVQGDHCTYGYYDGGNYYYDDGNYLYDRTRTLVLHENASSAKSEGSTP